MSVPTQPRPPFLSSLSARLLLLTIVFVMIGEVLIYVPSVVRFRITYLEERVAAARLATLSFEMLPARAITEALRKKLLDQSKTYNIVLRLPKCSIFVSGTGPVPPASDTFDLRQATFIDWISDAADTLAQKDNRVIRVIGNAPGAEDIIVEVMLDERPLREAMWDFSVRILGLSIFISVIAAGLVFVSLHWLMVRPMHRITESMTAFRANPTDESADIVAGGRGDEIGVAQRELGIMQKEVRLALRQRRRLAALGSAVAKINHDLRNSLSTAMLASDRLAGSSDPDVKRVLPRLFDAIDRAVDLCLQTLNFASQDSPTLSPSCFSLRDLIDEVGQAIQHSDIGAGGVEWNNEVNRHKMIEADRDQLFRALINVSRNAYQAGAGKVTVDCKHIDERICIEVADDGPGLPDKARENLYTPFMGSTQPGGTGLGLVIVRDVMRAHGGDITLVETGPGGTTFCLELPEKVPEGARFWI
ncbi:MAG: HAMP domain-containing sensor histidine kinase [Rhodospirillales bacterium]|jgi:signal transduction histidine kinase|nr:HAMP domain-containing sensor histidine kinase [Rhodospirillales bacterium]MDP6642507.1 HAMP domain-containing sensor histidine kinase [Rhodospirillales bacterium]MDP6841449.1 HAMP domain-containing sensor histidine kinase [Rhodospirillales bacterium]